VQAIDEGRIELILPRAKWRDIIDRTKQNKAKRIFVFPRIRIPPQEVRRIGSVDVACSGGLCGFLPGSGDRWDGGGTLVYLLFSPFLPWSIIEYRGPFLPFMLGFRRGRGLLGQKTVRESSSDEAAGYLSPGLFCRVPINDRRWFLFFRVSI